MNENKGRLFGQDIGFTGLILGSNDSEFIFYPIEGDDEFEVRFRLKIDDEIALGVTSVLVNEGDHTVIEAVRPWNGGASSYSLAKIAFASEDDDSLDYIFNYFLILSGSRRDHGYVVNYVISKQVTP